MSEPFQIFLMKRFERFSPAFWQGNAPILLTKAAEFGGPGPPCRPALGLAKPASGKVRAL
jgi:hypothetical protein